MREYTPEELAEIKSQLEDLWHDGSESIYDMNAASSLEGQTIMRKEDFIKHVSEFIAHRLHSKQQPWISPNILPPISKDNFARNNGYSETVLVNEMGEVRFGYYIFDINQWNVFGRSGLINVIGWQPLPSTDGSVQEMFTKEQMVEFGKFCMMKILAQIIVAGTGNIPNPIDENDLFTQFNQQTKGG